MTQARKRGLSLLTTALLLVGMAVPSFATTTDTPKPTLGESGISVTVKESDIGILDVADVTDEYVNGNQGNEIYFPIGETAFVKDVDSLYLRVTLTVGPRFSQDDYWCDDIRIITKNGPPPELVDDFTRGNVPGPYIDHVYKIRGNTTIDARMTEGKPKEDKELEGFYFSESKYFFPLQHTGDSTMIETQISAKSYSDHKINDTVYSLKDGLDDADLFVLDSIGNLRSKGPLPAETYVVPFIATITTDDGKSHQEDANVYVSVGSTVHFIRPVTPEARYLYDFSADNIAMNATLSEIIAAESIPEPRLYNYTFDGWYTNTNKLVADNDYPVTNQESPTNDLNARFVNAEGHVYAAGLGGGGPIEGGEDENSTGNNGGNNGGSSGSSSRGSSRKSYNSNNQRDTSPNLAASPTKAGGGLSQQAAKTILSNALKNKKSGTAIVPLKDVKNIGRKVANSMVQQANGAPFTIVGTTTGQNGKTIAQVRVPSAALTGDISLFVSTDNHVALRVKKQFEAQFKQSFVVLESGQTTPFAAPVTYVLPNGAALGGKTLVCYAYEPAAKSYTAFVPQKAWIDQKGNLCLTTTQAGIIVITNQVLV